MAFNIGETAGDYQVVGILGAGGMGKVYKVRNVISDRIEAMKVLLPDLATEPELADRFMREIKLLASLNHPNIAALHTALRVENQLVMIMEFVEGRTLESRLAEGKLPVREAVEDMMQVLAALGYAHDRGVVHRDIKPANMMVTPDGTVKLMDFGIAKAAADHRLTVTGTTLGSLSYMSPEQVKGSSNLDARSDLYSVGVSLYELVTGTRPFKGDSDYSLMVAHLEQQPVPPIQVDPTLSPTLNEIILVAIEKDPAQRFQTASAFRNALESVVAGLPAAAQAPAAAGPVITPPVFAATQAAAPSPAVAPQVQPVAQAAPQPAGRRGVWILVGAVLVLAVLAVAALQLPKFFRTRAGGEATAPASVQAPATPAQSPPAQPPAPEPALAVPPAVGQAVSPVQDKPRSVPRTLASKPPSSPPQAPPSAPLESQPSAQQQPAAPVPAQAQPAEPPVNAAALAEARDRYRLLSVRANSASRSLRNLEAQQAQSGLGLRGDISAAWDHAQSSLQDAAAALKAVDLAEAKRAMDTAERQIDLLDKFLGR